MIEPDFILISVEPLKSARCFSADSPPFFSADARIGLQKTTANALKKSTSHFFKFSPSTSIECEECRRQYEELLTAYLRLRRKIRKMRRAFARIEGALLSRPKRHFETIVGECEMYRGKNAVPCYTHFG